VAFAIAKKTLFQNLILPLLNLPYMTSLSLQDFRDLTEGPFDRRMMTYLRLRGFTSCTLRWNLLNVGDDGDIGCRLEEPDEGELCKGSEEVSIRGREARWLRECSLLRSVNNISATSWWGHLYDSDDSRPIEEGTDATLEFVWDFKGLYVGVEASWVTDVDQDGAATGIATAEKSFDYSHPTVGPRCYAFAVKYCEDMGHPLPEPLHALALYDALMENAIDFSGSERLLRKVVRVVPSHTLNIGDDPSQRTFTRDEWESEETAQNYLNLCIDNGWIEVADDEDDD
jgi:hypothetical protein